MEEMRDAKVVGFMPSNSAAPPGPKSLPFGCFNALMRLRVPAASDRHALGARPGQLTSLVPQAHSPLLGWTYDFLSIRTFSTILGFVELSIASLMAMRSVSPKASAVGSLLAIGMFLTTLSFLFSTPGWKPTLGFPALSAMPGQFLLKDVVPLGASVWSLGESVKAMNA
jgi:uncharacterized protein DUF417